MKCPGEKDQGLANGCGLKELLSTKKELGPNNCGVFRAVSSQV